MRRMIQFVALLLLVMTDWSGAADFEVEQVKSPFVEKKDVGQMMASEHRGLSQHSMQATSPLHDYPYSTPKRKSRRCLSCQQQSYGSSSSYSTGGITGGGASLGSTSSFSFGSDSNYNQPLQSSSRHEFSKEQEFVNGQQVYDFHHEKRYKDGQLIDEKRHEIGPGDYDSQHQPSASSGYASLSSSSGMLQTLDQGGAPPNIYYENNYQRGMPGGVGYESKFNEFTQKFHSEVERMREELERKSMSLPTHQLSSPPSYGSSHRTEYRTQTKYVNGKPVYLFNEERKYKDGKLIHNVTEEKGSDDLGTATIPGSQSRSSLAYGGYPTRPINYAGSHSSYDSTSDLSSNTGRSYRPSNTGSSVRQAASSSALYSPSNPPYSSNTHQSASHTSTGYHPNERPYGTDVDAELPNSERPYPSSPSYASSNQLYNKEVAHSHSQISTDHYSHERPNNRDTAEHDTNRSNYNYAAREPTSSSYPSSNPAHTSISQRAHHESATNYRSNIQERPQVVSTDRSDYGSSSHYTPSEPNPTYSRSQPTYINSLHHSGRQTSTNYQLSTPDHARGTYTKDSEHRDYPRPSYHNGNPSETTPRPSRYGYGTRRESYAPEERKLEETEQRRNTDNIYRPHINTATHSGEKIAEASQTSYFESRKTSTRPGSHDASTSNSGIHVVNQNQAPRVSQYRPAVQRTSHAVRKETERRYQRPSYGHRVNETSRIYEPRTHATATSTWEEEPRRSSSTGYESPEISYRPGRYGTSKDDDGDNKYEDTPHNGPKHAIPPASYPGARNYGRGPERNDESREVDDKEVRSDISPYEEVLDLDRAENEMDTNRPSHEEFHTHPTNRDSIYGRAKTHAYEESESATREQSIDYGYQPVRVRQQDGSDARSPHTYSIHNSSRTDHRVTTLIPSRWVETRTTWEYINGRVESETQHYRFYENGILVHENTTHKTREEMERDGQDVESLDLSSSQLAQYGQSLPSTTHSQKHEIYQVQRFRNGQKTYEMNHERQFQDGILMHENKEEKDEDDFEDGNELTSPYGNPGDHSPIGNHIKTQRIGARSQVGAEELYHMGVGSPRNYINKHEVRKEEEYVNGQKVYDFHHEREYQDGRLVRENRTELGPDDLGASEDAPRNLIRGRAHSAIDENSLQEQRTGILKTTCLTCGGSHLNRIQQGGTAMGSHGYNSDSLLSREDSMHTIETSQSTLGTHPSLRPADGSSFRHDFEVEEHYENGQLIKGREESKKWRDGTLVDADREHYYGGPSRAGKISNLVSEMDSTAAFSSSPTRTVTRRRGNECASNPCHNRGRCRSNGSRPVCTCPFGFKGEFCQEAYCPSRYCRYGGSCSISGSTHICQCLEGYSGHRCSSKDYNNHG